MNPYLQKQAQEQAEFCQIFSNEKRVLILWALQTCPELSVGDLAHSINTSLQNTSQHLRVLKECGIVTSRRDGHTIYYRIKQPPESKCSLLNRDPSEQSARLLNRERAQSGEKVHT
jgi:DNA-binding transcriptional ArsR family regulator